MSIRPDRLDAKVQAMAIELFWPKLEKYVLAMQDVRKEDLPEWKKSAEKVLNRCTSIDGYEIAKDFEDESWDVDTEFVDIADQWPDCIREAHRKVVAAWVVAESIKPKLAMGAKAKAKVDVGKGHWHREIREGEIVGIDEKHATYHVFIESLGHVRPGTVTSYGVTGVILTFEEVEGQNP